MNREAVADFLKGLSRREVIELFYEINAHWDNHSDEKFGTFDRLLLARVMWEKVDPGEHRIYILAAGKDPENNRPSVTSVCENGQCKSCGMEVDSWSKQATCPICGICVHCT